MEITEIIEELQKLKLDINDSFKSFNSVLDIEDNNSKMKILDFISIIINLKSGHCPSEFNFKDQKYVIGLERVCDMNCSECWFYSINKEKSLLKEKE